MADGGLHKLSCYIRFAGTLAGVTNIIDAYVAGYCILLDRALLRSVRAVGFYADDEYCGSSIATPAPMLGNDKTKGYVLFLKTYMSKR